mgnify:CR=1 FL=1
MYDRAAADQAEVVVEGIMRQIGFPDARATQRGGDHGIDVTSRDAVAQVKWQATKVGRPALQNLVGAAHLLGTRKLLFFARVGYSPQAIEFANKANIALFTFDLHGTYAAVNGAASSMRGSSRRSKPPKQQIDPEVAAEQLRFGNGWRAAQRREEEARAQRDREFFAGRAAAERDAAEKQRLRDERVAAIIAEGKKPRSVGKQALVTLIHLIALITGLFYLAVSIAAMFSRDSYPSTAQWVGWFLIFMVISIGGFCIAAMCGHSTRNSEVIE